MGEIVTVKFRDRITKITSLDSTKFYHIRVVAYNGKKVLYVRIKKALYICLRSAIIFCRHLLEDLKI